MLRRESIEHPASCCSMGGGGRGEANRVEFHKTVWIIENAMLVHPLLFLIPLHSCSIVLIKQKDVYRYVGFV